MIKDEFLKIRTKESFEHIHEIALAFTIEEAREQPEHKWTIQNFYERYQKNCEELINYTSA